MLQEVKLWRPDVNGGKPFWVQIAHESDKDKDYIFDDDIYFYTDSDNPCEKGDLIQLDEWFAILEVEE